MGINCLLCGNPELTRIGINGKPRSYTPTGDFLCSLCTKILVNSAQDKIKVAFEKAVENKLTQKINFLERQLEGKNDDQGTATGISKNSKRHLARSRVVRQVKSTRHEVRSKRTT